MTEKEEKKIPVHVGLILDGNRRWAKERNLPSSEGHSRGHQKVKKSIDWFFNRGVKYISIYVFSTENWSRPQEEVNFLMKLTKVAMDEQLKEAIENDYRVLISGRIDDLPGDLPESCFNLIEKSKNGSRGTLNICLNYGGRAEIVDAIKKMIKNNIEIEQVHEGMIKKYLYSADIPDPDIIVRTSGEQRLSGFLLWQSAYSELLFLEKYWPDFEEKDVEKIIDEYNSRNRRFGGN